MIMRIQTQVQLVKLQLLSVLILLHTIFMRVFAACPYMLQSHLAKRAHSGRGLMSDFVTLELLLPLALRTLCLGFLVVDEVRGL